MAVSQPSPEGSEETSLCLKRKLVQEIVCSASSTMSRVVAIVFSFPHCVIEYFPNRLGVEQLQIPVLVESIVSPTLDAILSAEKLVRGKCSFYPPLTTPEKFLGSFGDLWRNTFGDFQSNNPLNSDQADRNSENERMSTIYYKIQRFLFSGNISSCLLPPFLFNSELVKERTDVERPESTDITDVNMSSYSERTVYIALLPVVQFIRSCSFSGVTFRFPNPNFGKKITSHLCDFLIP